MSAITIPDGFFPPPGVPFDRENQIGLATSMAHNNIIDLEVLTIGGAWVKWAGLSPAVPRAYRLAPPKPRTVGPFESESKLDGSAFEGSSAWSLAYDAANKAGFKKFRIRDTATAEEIL